MVLTANAGEDFDAGSEECPYGIVATETLGVEIVCLTEGVDKLFFKELKEGSLQ